MFGRKTLAQKRIDSLIGAGTVVDGDISFSGGLRIDGQVRGNVTAANGDPCTLVVSEHARVDGEIRVSHVVINGTINGPVTADDYLELQANARINRPGGGSFKQDHLSEQNLKHVRALNEIARAQATSFGPMIPAFER